MARSLASASAKASAQGQWASPPRGACSASPRLTAWTESPASAESGSPPRTKPGPLLVATRSLHLSTHPDHPLMALKWKSSDAKPASSTPRCEGTAQVRIAWMHTRGSGTRASPVRQVGAYSSHRGHMSRARAPRPVTRGHDFRGAERVLSRWRRRPDLDPNLPRVHRASTPGYEHVRRECSGSGVPAKPQRSIPSQDWPMPYLGPETPGLAEMLRQFGAELRRCRYQCRRLSAHNHGDPPVLGAPGICPR